MEEVTIREKKINYYHIPFIKTTKEIDGINPFSKDLSFAQRDKYGYELGYLLKKEFKDYFKQEWIQFRSLSDQPLKIGKHMIRDAETIWEDIDSKLLFGNLNLELHQAALNIISGPFTKIIDLIDKDKSDYEINNKIKSLTGTYYIYHKIKDSLKDKFLVNLDYSSYVYNEETKLYSFNKNKNDTLRSLRKYLKPFRENVENIYQYFDNEHNKRILDSILNNLSSEKIQLEILDMVKTEIRFFFNNEKKFEIPYQDKVIDLKEGTMRNRTYRDHYTTTINATYLINYDKNPEYIKSIFGKDKEELLQNQILLGSLLTGCALDKFILFYGTGANSKTKLILGLKEILNDLQLNLNYEKYINEKDTDDLIDNYYLNERRIIAIDDINCKTFLKDESRFKRILSDRKFNFIAASNEEPSKSNNIAMDRRLIKLNFPYSFIENPDKNKQKKVIRDLEINKDYLFTWLVRGAHLYLKDYKEIKSNSKVGNESLKVRSFDFCDFTSSEDENSDEEEVEEIKVETNPIVSFVKENIIISPNGRIIKKDLWKLYCEEKNVQIEQKEFNSNVRDYFKNNNISFGEKQSNNVLFWTGVESLKS